MNEKAIPQTERQIVTCDDCPSKEFKIYNSQAGILTCADCGQFKTLLIAKRVAGVPCKTCGQVDHGQTGEYSCSECGLPTLHDANDGTGEGVWHKDVPAPDASLEMGENYHTQCTSFPETCPCPYHVGVRESDVPARQAGTET